MVENLHSNIADRLEFARQQIADFASLAGRQSSDVKLVAVSKTKPIDAIITAYHAGQRCFAENYVQEAVEKIQALSNYSDIEWHFIGPLQSNKTRLVAENFAWCQTLDREKIAKRLDQQRPSNLPPLNVCIQINIDDEDTKAGIAIDDVLPLAKSINSLEKLRLRGIMSIPSANTNLQDQMHSFHKLKQIFEELRLIYADVDTLSLGMSNDLENAIAAGSTMVRIGTAIFGARNK